MGKFIFIYISLFLLISCKSGTMQSSKNELGGSNLVFGSNKILVGYWRYVEDDFISMIISKDSIYYPDQLYRLKYKANSKSILLFDHESIDTIGYTMKGKDTLIFLIANKHQTYIRNVK